MKDRLYADGRSMGGRSTRDDTSRCVVVEAIGGSLPEKDRINQYEEAIGSVPKGLKKGSAACR